MDAQAIVELLHLEPHPEGGFFVETYRSGEQIEAEALPERYKGARCHGTAIYYLLTADTFSAIHRIDSDEIFHFYHGDPVQLVRWLGNGKVEQTTLGTRLELGERPQAVVPRGVWQGLKVATGGSFALLGATVAPGFDFSGFELANRDQMLADYPTSRAQILELT